MPPVRLTPVEQAVLTFERYLRDERMLAEVTVINYVTFVCKFLVDRFGHGSVKLSGYVQAMWSDLFSAKPHACI